MKRKTIENAIKFAKEKDGKCLSAEYTISGVKLRWQCKYGHIWETKYNNILQGKWCPYCAGTMKKSIKDAKKLAEEKGGKCLSTKYINNGTKMRWQCKYDHVWEATYDSISRGRWCPYCGGRMKKSIEDAHKLAEEKGGKCLSTKYINNGTKMKWQCKYGHVWETCYNKIKEGKWCKYCNSGSIGEKICEKILETRFGCKFPKVKPEWLINNEGNRMELDGYCKKLKLAFEYNGEQHYKNISMFFKNNKEFEKRLEMDKLKIKLCKKNDVNLIIVPYNIKNSEIESFILKQCKKFGLDKYIIDRNSIIDYNKIYTYNYNKEKYNLLQNIVFSRNGSLISSQYYGAQEKYEFKCNICNYEWKASYNSVRRGGWCPNCAGNIKKTIKDAKKLAEEKGGKCLSIAYINSGTKLKWQCNYGHIWETPYDNIQHGSWCPYCAKRIKRTIVEMQEIAKKRGGKCLSTEYINANTKLLWECKYGHQWMAFPCNIYNHWCFKCSNRIYTIEEIDNLAKFLNIKCLFINKDYNSITKFLWECEKGHKWKDTPYKVELNGMCPICGKGE